MPPAQPDKLEDDDDLDPDEALDEPGEEVLASRPEPNDALKAERRKTNQLERELRTIKRQLAQFSKINPDEYERLQEAERQKEQLEHEIASRELQLEAAAARKVKAAAKERDEALQDVQNLRKDRLLERLFIDAEGRPGGDNRGSFFEIFKQQVGSEFRPTKDGNGRDVLEPIDSKGNALLSDNGNLQAAEHVESLRTHPVLGLLFQQRGGIGPTTVIAEFDGNGQATNLQNLSASELYLASYAKKPAGARR
jgi:DNA repair exonuclease SbcCD ATPase subunit